MWYTTHTHLRVVRVHPEHLEAVVGPPAVELDVEPLESAQAGSVQVKIDLVEGKRSFKNRGHFFRFPEFTPKLVPTGVSYSSGGLYSRQADPSPPTRHRVFQSEDGSTQKSESKSAAMDTFKNFLLR